jgi:ATPase subunit of ABC transporter with duplicated ATPase domains
VKTRQLSERAGRIEAAARPAHRERGAGVIRLEGSESHARALVTLEEADLCAPDGRLLFRTGRKWIAPGDRVVVLGPNGSGKTQLVRAILAAGPQGPVRRTAGCVLGYCDQMLAQLPPGETPFALVSRLTSADATARSLLAGAGVLPDWQGRKVAVLSGGQRARLALLLLRLQRPNFFLLDEPTNHLDIEGQEALEGELMAQETACLLVSHDRAFLRAVGNRFWQILPGRRGAMLEEVDSPEPFLRAEAGA